MKKLLCLILTIMLMLTCVGCSSTLAVSDLEEPEAISSSFVIVEKKLIDGYFYKIVYHKDTKVMYVLGQYNDFEVMLDSDGKPLLWEG